MATNDERISQFRYMAEADPDNEMAHFSLASALLEAQRPEDAVLGFQRCLELDAGMSRAYELGGRSLLEAGRAEEALAMLKTGYAVAAKRGDVKPRDAIAGMLTALGETPPEVATKVAPTTPTGAFVCARTGIAGTQLAEAPMRGPVGEWIHDHISAETWAEWIGQGTKVINELKLDFSRDEDQHAFDVHMAEYLGIPEELIEQA